MDASRDDFIIAIRSAFLRKGNKQRFSLLSLILFSIVFLILGNFNLKIIKFNRTIITEIVYFSSFIVNVPENIIKKSFNNISNHFYDYDQYQKTKNELQKLKNKDLSKKILTYENVELKKLIDDYFVDDSQSYAKVLIDKESPFLRSIIINKGSKNGVKAGMIVYDNIYLIGKVVEVNFLTSRVLLITDLNSKVPVTIQPLNVEAIMSGFEEQKGKLKYIKGEKLNNNISKELIVVTSGSGGVFKSGIPVGKINLNEFVSNNQMVVDFYKDFSQLRYVKVVSFSKENNLLDLSSKKNVQKIENEIEETNQQQETLRILLEQKRIADEIRIKIQKENDFLRNERVRLKNEILVEKKNNQQNRNQKEEIKFLEMNLVYGQKCRKSIFNKLYKVGTAKYRECVLNKGLKK